MSNDKAAYILGGESHMELFYETLTRYDLTLEKLPKTLGSIGVSQLNAALEKLQLMIYKENRDISARQDSLFNFVANENICGGPSSCEEPECRLKRAQKLCEFSALYADRVLVRNPIKPYLDRMRIEKLDDRIRTRLLGDFLVIWLFEPLLTDGLFQFAQSEHHFCTDCYKRYSSNEFFNYEERLENVYSYLQNVLNSKVSVYAVNNTNGFHLQIDGPEDIIEHQTQVIHFVYYIPQTLKKYLKNKGKYKLSRKEMEDIAIFKGLFNQNIEDFAVQDWYTKNFDYTYLTNRSLDIDLIRMVNGDDLNRTSEYFIDGLTHTIPALSNLSVTQLLKLRKQEGNAFEDYRNNLRRVIKELKPKSASEVREAFQEKVKPEIDKIQRKIKERNKLLIKNLSIDAIIYTGIVTIGLFSGLLPANIGTIVGALGGIGFGHSLVKRLTNFVTVPGECRENPYFFLWKVKKRGTQKH